MSSVSIEGGKRPTKLKSSGAFPSDLNSRLLMSHCLDHHPTDSRVTISASFWDVLAGASDAGDTFKDWTCSNVLAKWQSYSSQVAERYITRPNYRRIDGRPVLFFGRVHAWEFYKQFLISPREIVDTIRSIIPNAYLVATATEREVRPLLKSWGFDAHTDYLLHGRGWPNTMEVYRWSWNQGIEIARQTGCTYWIPCTSGYDGSAWDTPESREGFSHVPTPEQFTAHIKEAKALAQKHPKETALQVILYSWNEFGEQRTPIEPTMRNGDAYLRAFRDAA